VKAQDFVKILSTVGGLTTDNVAVKLMTTGDAFDTLDRMRRCSFVEIASLVVSSANSSPNSTVTLTPPVAVNNWTIVHNVLPSLNNNNNNNNNIYNGNGSHGNSKSHKGKIPQGKNAFPVLIKTE
jgi:hypothetical protein